VHEVSFDILRGLIALHLLAISYYCFMRRRPLVRPMVTGRTSLPEGVLPMTPAAKGRFVACLLTALLLAALIVGVGPKLGG